MTQQITNENKQWFFEATPPGATSSFKQGIEIIEKLYEGKSKFQRVEFYDTKSFGKILVLDGIIQTSEKDEFIYHENMCHLPMFYHPNPKKVLIIGGGDGGSLREIVKHPVEKVWMVEIDGDVVELSKKHLPTLSDGAFESKKAEVIIGDGKKFIKDHKNFFDVIVLDLSDPHGPAEDMISATFYNEVKEALTENGVISIQSGSLSHQYIVPATVYKNTSKVFKSVKLHHGVVPTYQGGMFSFTIAAKFDLNIVKLEDLKKRFEQLDLKLKYYNPEIHLASAVLPTYIKDLLK